MPWVLVAYGFAAVVALILLGFYHATRWYWHLAAIVVAFTIGLIPTPGPFQGDLRPFADAVVGTLFVFLLFWGIGAPFFRRSS